MGRRQLSWKDRLREGVTLTAPDGTVFAAGWIGNDFSLDKSVGQFRYPLVDGTRTQDLGVSSFVYPMTLQFEGDNNDLDAHRFAKACAQRGPWQVVHPIYGNLNLQPYGTITVHARPAESGNLTVVDTQWIDSIGDATTVPATEISAQIMQQAEVANAAANDQFADGFDAGTPDAVALGAQLGLSAVKRFTASTIGVVVKAAADASALFAAAYNTIVSDLSQAILVPSQIASDLQGLIQLAQHVSDSGAYLVAQFQATVNSFLDLIPAGNDASARNQVEMIDLACSASVIAAAQVVAVMTPDTREQAVLIAQGLSSMFLTVIDGLDQAAISFADLPLADRYQPMANAYSDLALLVGLAIRYVLSILYDLKVARTFVLDRPRAAIEITITEYGAEFDSQGNSYYDYLITTNQLHGREVVVVPAGREITIYEAAA